MMYVIDKSAYEIAKRHPQADLALDVLASGGPVAICAMAALEILYSSRTPAEHHDVRHSLKAQFSWIATPDEALAYAVELQELMHAHGKHRKPLPDIIIAAVARYYGATVLHYDSDFDDISSVDDRVRSRWIIPRQRNR